MSLKALARERLAIIGDTPAVCGRQTVPSCTCFSVSDSRDRNTETPQACEEVRSALQTLGSAPPPKHVTAHRWDQIVGDAHALMNNGWVAIALRLGWTEHHLFGVAPGISSTRDGLALELAGRPLLLLDETGAIIRNGERDYSNYSPGKTGGMTLLWNLP